MKTVDDIMAKGNAVSSVSGDTCVRELLEIMDHKQLGAVCVIDDGVLEGIITDGDFRRLILNTQDTLPTLFMKLAGHIMIRDPKTVVSGTSIDDCLDLLMRHRFWVVPVVDKANRLLGMVHMQDLIHAKLANND